MNMELETTPRFQSTIEAAKSEARRFGHGYVGVEHIMLAITNDPNSVAAVALSQSTSLARVRHDLENLLNSPGYKTPSSPTDPQE